MKRGKKLSLNTMMALVYQFITLICGFVLPKFVIPYFGSATNGLINSITQFLTIITLCECGVGAVVQSALYKPLAERDNDGISQVVLASRKFFNNILRLLLVYVCILMLVYPFVIKEDFSYLYTASLILILALSYIAQYYLFLTYRLLLNADQRSFVQLGAHSLALILNTVATIILIRLGASVHVVKLAAALVFLIQSLIIKFYVDKHYKLNLKLKPISNALSQKWNGLAQHIASVGQQNVATVVLTFFATLKDISVYSMYYLVAHGVRQIIVSLNTGMQAMLGNMYAKKETETLHNTYATIELAFHTIVTLTFTITGILLIPFIRIYTINFTDAEYVYPLFGTLMVLAQAAYCIRIPYEMMIRVAGHYKQTQTSSFIEAGLCAVLSCLLVLQFGLIGVAIGIFVSMCYRTVYLVWYLSKNILCRKIQYFVRHIVVDVLSVCLMVLATSWIKLSALNYFAWIIMAVHVGVICLVISILLNSVFFRKKIFAILYLIKRKKRK